MSLQPQAEFDRFQSLRTEKENETILYLYLIDIGLLRLDNFPSLTLVCPVADNDLISHHEAGHNNLPGADRCVAACSAYCMIWLEAPSRLTADRCWEER